MANFTGEKTEAESGLEPGTNGRLQEAAPPSSSGKHTPSGDPSGCSATCQRMRGDPGGARGRPWGGWGGGRGHLGAPEALLVGTHLLGLSATGRPVLGWPQAGWLWMGQVRMGSGEVRDGGWRSARAAGQGPCWSRAGSRVQMTREPPTGRAERAPRLGSRLAALLVSEVPTPKRCRGLCQASYNLNRVTVSSGNWASTAASQQSPSSGDTGDSSMYSSI